MPIHDIAGISKTTKPIKMKIQHNIGAMKMNPLMQYYDVTTNSRWRMAAILVYHHIFAKNHLNFMKFSVH